jgi:hypothetical protein
MTPQTAQDAYDEILAHIQKQGGTYSQWYCGIASDWEDRLFNDHNVPRKDHWRTVRQCYNNSDARAVEKSLLDLGCDGGGGGGDESTVYVYAYLKGSMTDP